MHSNRLPDVNTLVRDVADFAPIRLGEVETVFEALSRIRNDPGTQQCHYFYVTDCDDRLVGVAPVRRLLLADPSTLVGELMVHPVLSVAESDTFGEAVSILAGARLFALPVVDESGRLTRVVDVSGMTRKLVDLERRELPDRVFQMVGMRTGESGGKEVQRVSQRFLWPLLRMMGGVLAAFMLYLFSAVVRKDAGIVLFIPAVVMAAECAAIRSVTMSLVNVPSRKRRRGRAWSAWLLVVAGAALLGGALARSLGFVSLAMSVGTSLLVACALGTFLGYSVPRLLVRWRLAAKVASGPVVLALSDVAALCSYLAISAALA